MDFVLFGGVLFVLLCGCWLVGGVGLLRTLYFRVLGCVTECGLGFDVFGCLFWAVVVDCDGCLFAACFVAMDLLIC